MTRTAVAALKSAEVVEVHVGVRVEPGVGAGRGRLGNPCPEGARPEVVEIYGIHVAVMVEITQDHGAGLARDRACQQLDREDQRAEKLLSVHVEISVNVAISILLDRGDLAIIDHCKCLSLTTTDANTFARTSRTGELRRAYVPAGAAIIAVPIQISPWARRCRARPVLACCSCGATMAARSAVRVVRFCAGTRAIAVRLTQGAAAVWICRLAGAAVATLERAEVVHIHVLVGVEPGVDAGRRRLGNRRTQGARPEVAEIRGIDVAVMVEITQDHRCSLTRERVGQQEDREYQRAAKPVSVHVETSVVVVYNPVLKAILADAPAK
jgi:hypothetical protein